MCTTYALRTHSDCVSTGETHRSLALFATMRRILGKARRFTIEDGRAT
jgi:hypothetical protein